MSPGTYLAEHRAGAGIAHADIVAALRLIGAPRLANDMMGLLPAIEADRIRASTDELMALRITFPFSPGTYRRLCAEADALAALTPNESL